VDLCGNISVPPIEGKIADVVLKRIRGLQTTPSIDAGVAPAERRANGAKSVSVREAQFSDFARVCALNLRLGQGPDSTANWQRLWRENPALADQRESPIGWVIEASHDVVGFLGSVPLQYEFRGSALQAAATCRFAVEPGYRAFSHLLVASFLRQKNVDLFLNTTATAAAGRIMTALKASPLPQPDYGTVLFWVLDPGHFTKEVLKKLGVKTPFIQVGAAMGSLALRGDVTIRGRAPRARSSRYEIRETTVGEIGREFDQLWFDCSKESVLWARRSPDIMRWHFDPPGNRRHVTVLSCYAGKKLTGYMIVRHEPAEFEGLRRSLVADLLVRENDPDVLEHLFAAACACANVAGCHVLEVMGFPPRIRRIVLRWKPYARSYPAQPFFFKARDRHLHQQLLDKDAWYACPFDGDSTLWP
jgi:hypothetical protein